MKAVAVREQPVWDEVLENALAGCSGGLFGLQAFLEERADLVVELDDRAADPAITHHRLRGLSVRGPFERAPMLYRAEPRFEDPSKMVSTVLGRPRIGEDSGRGGRFSAGRVEPLPAGPASVLLRDLIEGTLRESPRARVGARWVAFEQRVRIARPGDPVQGDFRSGRRVRLEARLDEHGPTAVEELALSQEGGQGLASVPQALAERLEALADARPVPDGPRPVVFAPGVGGVLVHELVGHALEADTVLLGGSWLARREPPVASPEVRVIDDPRRGRGAWRIDDEGEPARVTLLVSEGQVAGALCDQRTTSRSGDRSTGHGRRASYREPVRPRMGCTFMAPGSCEPQEVFEDIRDGIHVRRMESASTDPSTGRAVFRVTDADRIEDGRLSHPLQPHLLWVDGRQALTSVDRIADDMAFDRCIGSCLRDGQPLATSVGAPTFRIGLANAVSWIRAR